jgi:hypothetical protein
MTDDEALKAAYLAGFNASGEGYNGEYPFHGAHPEQDAGWIKNRDNEITAIKQARSAPTVQEPVAQSLKDAVFTVLEGFTLPHDVRKILEAAYYTPPAAPVPVEWMEMATANLVREGVNKHKARELAEHFYNLKENT